MADGKPKKSFDGGHLDCGNGLLLLIRKELDSIASGEILEILSAESSVGEDLPAWCRLTLNELLKAESTGVNSILWIQKKADERSDFTYGMSTPTSPSGLEKAGGATAKATQVKISQTSPLQSLSVMGVGSWPRPDWLLGGLDLLFRNSIDEQHFSRWAADAVELAVAAQVRAGVDFITDGEQRRDAYCSFLGRFIKNCQMVPLRDLAAMADHPEDLATSLEGVDLPMDHVRQPVLTGKLNWESSATLWEVQTAARFSTKPIKVALPGPYLLARTLWLDCLPHLPYASQEHLADDVTRYLRAEIQSLLDGGASLIQLDEPILTEVVFDGGNSKEKFMCGALSKRRSAANELAFALELVKEVTRGFPVEKIGMHICRGNWSRDESQALSGSYQPLISFLKQTPVGFLTLEGATSRAGDVSLLAPLCDDHMVGIGMVNQKSAEVESVPDLVDRLWDLRGNFPMERLFFTPDCGFATFAHQPLAARIVAEQKLSHLVRAVDRIR